MALFLFTLTNSSIQAQCDCSTPNILTIGSNVSANASKLSTAGNISTLSGGCLLIKGTFTIDNSLTWSLTNVVVYLDVDPINPSRIVVTNGAKLVANISTFKTCVPSQFNADKWREILVEAGGSISLNKCTIRDAHYGVRVAANEIVKRYSLNSDFAPVGIYINDCKGTNKIRNNYIYTINSGRLRNGLASSPKLRKNLRGYFLLAVADSPATKTA